MIEELINYLAPILAGTLTTVVVPLLIKKSTQLKISNFVDGESKRIDNHDKKILKRLENIEESICEMRGRQYVKKDID